MHIQSFGPLSNRQSFTVIFQEHIGTGVVAAFVAGGPTHVSRLEDAINVFSAEPGLIRGHRAHVRREGLWAGSPFIANNDPHATEEGI